MPRFPQAVKVFSKTLTTQRREAGRTLTNFGHSYPRGQKAEGA